MTIICPILGLKMDFLSIKLGSIFVHQMYERYKELLATTGCPLSSCSLLKNSALLSSLLILPIIVVKKSRKSDQYECIGGVRSYLLAQSIFPPDHEVPVIYIERPLLKEIQLIINVDMFVPPLMNSVKKLSELGEIYEKIGTDGLSLLLKDECQSRKTLAEKIGCAKNTIFPPANKQKNG